MGDYLIPQEFLASSPWWKDLLENPVSVQFLHRVVALVTAGFCVWLWVYQRDLEIPPRLSHAYGGIVIAALLQLGLGITTLLLVVPIALATLHQGFAFILFGSLIYSLFLLSRVRE